jgi:hypothetical protein
MLVKAAPGLKVPQEEKPRDYITDTPPDGEAGYTVPDSAYYLRRIYDGDLVEVASPQSGIPGAQSAAAPTTQPKKGAE